MNTPNIRLLISVRDVEEAKQAVAGGSDLIDVKEPANGPLGMANPRTVRSIVKVVGDRYPVSAAIGELCQPVPTDLPIELSYVKIGLAHAPIDWPGQLVERLAITDRAKLIVTAYADHQRVAAVPIGEIVDWAVSNRAAGVLIDTAIKDGCGLFDWYGPDELTRWIQQLRTARMLIALAGSLHGESLNRALDLQPDIVAVRGAACTGDDRLLRVDASRVRSLAHRVVEVRQAHSQRKYADDSGDNTTMMAVAPRP